MTTEPTEHIEHLLNADAHTQAAAVATGDVCARDLIHRQLARIEQRNPQINAYTNITHERALQMAQAIDDTRSRGESVSHLPLAGVPFAVKNLFDLIGIVTLAGSRVLTHQAPATHDAVLVQRLMRAGAIPVGALNMDEFAYGFTTENTHAGVCHNPHDLDCVAGGSSGGSGAALAAGMASITLATDTNGSIRVPSSLCGVFGLKPTFGRLPRTGSVPFVFELDHVGPMARSAMDLSVVYDVLQGHDAHDPACVARAIEPTLPAVRQACALPERWLAKHTVARLAGYFDEFATEQAVQSSRLVATILGASAEPTWADAPIARAAAFALTASCGGALHLPILKEHYADYEPRSRDRFVAGSLMPAAWLDRARRIRALARDSLLELLRQYDVLIAPATPLSGPRIDAETIDINGTQMGKRPALGLLAQPMSFVGVPVVTVPVWLDGYAMPLGVQIIAAPWREDVALSAAAIVQALMPEHVHAPVAHVANPL